MPLGALALDKMLHTTFDSEGQRLIDTALLNVVLVLVLTTAILGPVVTAYFAPA
jgi:hypothetical protein